MAKRPASGYASGGKRAHGPHRRARKRKGGDGEVRAAGGDTGHGGLFDLLPLSVHSPSTLSPLSFAPRSDLVRVFSEAAPNKVRTRSERETNQSIPRQEQDHNKNPQSQYQV